MKINALLAQMTGAEYYILYYIIYLFIYYIFYFILYFIKSSLIIGNALSESKHVSSFCKHCSSIVFLTEVFARFSFEDDPSSKAEKLSLRVVIFIYNNTLHSRYNEVMSMGFPARQVSETFRPITGLDSSYTLRTTIYSFYKWLNV